MCRTLFLLLLLVFCNFESVYSVSCLGCVDLDELSFDRTLKRFPYALVKFDIAFPFGEKHSAFGNLALAASKSLDDLLVATVGIKDYGEMENKNLGARFGYHEGNLPGILLFKSDAEEPIRFPEHLLVTEDNLKQFINDHTPLYLGCEGCLKHFNMEIKGYANMDSKQQLKVIETLQNLCTTLVDAEKAQSGRAYVAFAQKINKEGYDFIERETKRLRKLKAGRVSKAKKEELKRKLNILELYRVNKLDKKKKKKEL